MANHLGRTAQQPPLKPAPRIEWGQIAKVGDKYHLIRIVTQGDRIIEQHIGPGDGYRPVAEAEFQRWAVENVLDRRDDG